MKNLGISRPTGDVRRYASIPGVIQENPADHRTKFLLQNPVNMRRMIFCIERYNGRFFPGQGCFRFRQIFLDTRFL